MQDPEWRDEIVKGDNNNFQTVGCAIMAVADMGNIDPREINEKYVIKGCVSWVNISEDNGYEYTRSYDKFSTEVYTNQVNDGKNNYRVIINVNYDMSDHDHWVPLQEIKTIGNVDYAVITPTSIYDKLTSFDKSSFFENGNGTIAYSDDRLKKGWRVIDGKTYVPLEETKGYVSFVEKKSNY